MRRVIAKRLVLSKTTIPHSYISTTATMDKVMDLRKKMIASGNKVSLNDFVIKAAALALKVSVQLKFVYIVASQ
jgi:pyruvate/2-oxoglutarate dehydrogenase complex dihydrolipoamide acyltransferase (E2) component